MSTIARWPLSGAPILLTLASAGIGSALFGLVAKFSPDAFNAFPLWPAVAIAATFVVFVGGLSLAYPRVDVDLDAGTVRFGRRTVPISSLTRATRSHSTGGAATYLVYRLFSDTGASVRIIVAGGPMRPIRQDGAAALVALIERASIVEPHRDAAAEAAGLLAESVLSTGRSVPIGPSGMLRELAAVHGVQVSGAVATAASVGDAASASGPVSASAAAHASASPEPARSAGWSSLPLEDRITAWERDDADALAVVAELRSAPLVFRAASRWVLWLSVLAFVVAFGAGVAGVDEAWPVVLPLLIGFLLGWIGSRIATDVRSADVRRAAQTWLDADPERRERGLPGPFEAGWPLAGPATATWFYWAGVAIGPVALLFGILMLTLPSEGSVQIAPLGVTLTAIGLVAVAAGTWGGIVKFRERRRLVVEATTLAMPRLEALQEIAARASEEQTA
ncbi:hypothetical protein ACDF64_05470 [Agromyces sp. MMS24-JH15]|uniref:hypothetical protein n=1 Tax=Agromyces sp. MMS24-JH15 TaxID=3243765 RepID=UPI0037479E51